MTINQQNRFFRGGARLARRIDSEITKLSSLTRIEKADVLLERRRGGSPPFLADLRLAIPGPDLHASAEGFTPESALNKALGIASRALRDRKAKVISRQRKIADGFRPFGPLARTGRLVGGAGLRQ